MTFHRAEPNEHCRELRLREAAGEWELGLSLYASGMRLRMGRCGRPPSVMDFCLGQDSRIYLPVLDAVLARLAALPGDASAAEIDRQFPWQGTRPDLAIHLDFLIGENARVSLVPPPCSA